MSYGAPAPSAAPGAQDFKYSNNIQTPLLKAAASDEDAFVKFVRGLAVGKNTPEYKELYYFLLNCFSEADSDFDGLVGAERFDYMIERAACLPRKFGFAPSEAESFATPQQRQQFRADLFRKINTAGNGTIAFDEWLEWAYVHICLKAQQLNPSNAGNNWNEDSNAFKLFITNACRTTTSREYKQLKEFLQACFTRADQDLDGRVSVAEFDSMVEEAAAAPRKFGFAPSSAQAYSSASKRMASRQRDFRRMDVTNNGYVSFNDWMRWSYQHICGKAQSLDPSLPGVPPPDAAKVFQVQGGPNMMTQPFNQVPPGAASPMVPPGAVSPMVPPGAASPMYPGASPMYPPAASPGGAPYTY